MEPKKQSSPLPGGIVEMSEAQYNAHPAVRNSSLSAALKSGAHYLSYIKSPPEQTDAMALGTAIHFGVLEPKKFYAKYSPLPAGTDLRTKAGKDARDGILASGRLALKHDDFQTVERIIESVYSHTTASAYLTGGVTEHSYFWTHPEYQLECKARPDYLRDDGIYIDLKTTEDASLDEFTRSVMKWGYPRQGAFYQDGLKYATGRELVGCVLLAVEKTAPYGIGVFVLDEYAIEYGRQQYRRALGVIAECKRTGIYPGYPTETQVVSLPRWVQ